MVSDKMECIRPRAEMRETQRRERTGLDCCRDWSVLGSRGSRRFRAIAAVSRRRSRAIFDGMLLTTIQSSKTGMVERRIVIFGISRIMLL